jgi:hypothetical protein
VRRWLLSLVVCLLLVPTCAYGQQQYEIVNGPIVHVYPTVPSTPIVIENKIIYPTAPGQRAIDLVFPRTDSEVMARVVLRNVTIRPGNDFHFLDGIFLLNAWFSVFDNVEVIAPMGVAEPQMRHAIVLAGQSTEVRLRNLKLSGMETGLLIIGESEGTFIDSSSFIAVKYGIVAWPESGGDEPGLWITNSHINSSIAGIMFRNRLQVSLRDVLLYFDDHYQSDRGNPYYGVIVDTSRDVWTSNVTIVASNANVKKVCIPWTVANSARLEGRAEVRKR